MNKVSVFIAVLGISFAMYSCAKDNNCDTVKVTNASLQGNWKFESEITPEDSVLYAGNRFLNLVIVEDSFKVIIETFTDAIIVGCDSMPSYYYVKGIFSIDNDFLKMNGVYCNSDFSVKVDEDICHNVGSTYSKEYKAYFCENTLRIWGAGYYNQAYISMIKED